MRHLSFLLCGLLFLLSSFAYADPVRVKVGATLPLSGDLAHVGVDIRRGMEMAIEELADSPVKIEVVYEDNQHRTAQAVSAAQKLIEIDKVDILISLWDMADVVAPLAERRHIPHLSIRWNPHVAEKNKYTFTFESTYLTFVKSHVELLHALGATSLGLMASESQGWMLGAEALRHDAPALGLKIVYDKTFTDQETDFTTLATGLAAAKPDYVVIYAHQPQLDTIIRRIRERNPTQRISGYFEAVEPRSLVEGFPFAAQFDAAPWFVERFQKRYGEPFKVRAPHGYDLIEIIDSIYRSAGSKIPAEEFVTRVSALKDFKGAAGSLTTNATRNIETNCVWKIAHGGAFVALTPELIAELKTNAGTKAG